MAKNLNAVTLNCTDESLFHRILEISLGKWQWVKNNPRGNYLILKALWVTFLPVILSSILLIVVWYFESKIRGTSSDKNWLILAFQNDIFTFEHYKEYFLPLLAVFIVIYWNMWKDFHSKWEYCSNLFNQILASDENVKEKLRRALAVDLIILDLWAHRAFAEHFKLVLNEAIDHYPNKEIQKIYKRKIDANLLTEKEATEILEEYQRLDC